jgi:hypothetical protein
MDEEVKTYVFEVTFTTTKNVQVNAQWINDNLALHLGQSMDVSVKRVKRVDQG